MKGMRGDGETQATARRTRRRGGLFPRFAFGALAWMVMGAGGVAAQDPNAEPKSSWDDRQDDVALDAYLDALAVRRLLAEETGSVEQLRKEAREGEQRYFDARYDEAAAILFEVVESPRFRDFSSLEEYQNAELLVGRAFHELGALRTASRYLNRILARGTENNAYFGPAFRRSVDIALDGGNLPRAIARIEALGLDDLPEDANNEMLYLRGRERYDAGDREAAEGYFARITRRSRFFANAQYLRGALAVRQGALGKAEDHFCSIATSSDQSRFAFFVDDRYFRVKDLAWLALGRIAHEGGRSDDAFYYYFQVPQDSDRVAEALFEAAYAMYEGDDHDTALDLIDQLETRFPSSAHADEAKLLRGYVHLERCEFERADRLFHHYQKHFGPVVAEIDRVLASPARRARLYEQLLVDEGGRTSAVAGETDREARQAKGAREIMLAMLRVHPDFYRLHREVRTLDAEAARAGRLSAELEALRARLEGEDAPKAAAAKDRFEDEAAVLARDLEAARAIARGLSEQLDTLRQAKAPRADVRSLEATLRKAAQRLDALDQQRVAALHAEPTALDPMPADASFERLLARDIDQARRFPSRIAELRAKLVNAANDAALRNLRELRSRLAKGLRRSRIGRIDAVMGSKRRVEIQIESLAAGRFPPELQDPLRMQGLLRDDEEYWPFEGELWEDEFDETIPLAGGRGSPR